MDYELRKVRQRLGDEHDLELELAEDAREFLIDKGYNPDFGARPLRRAIEQHVEDPISEEILRGAYKDFAKIVVSVSRRRPRGPNAPVLHAHRHRRKRPPTSSRKCTKARNVPIRITIKTPRSESAGASLFG